MNSSVGDAERRQRAMAVARDVLKRDDLVAPSRAMLKEGPLTKLRRHKWGSQCHRSPRQAYLFSDLLVLHTEGQRARVLPLHALILITNGVLHSPVCGTQAVSSRRCSAAEPLGAAAGSETCSTPCATSLSSTSTSISTSISISISLSMQLVRVETCGYADGLAREATEIQNIQIADGAVRLHAQTPTHRRRPHPGSGRATGLLPTYGARRPPAGARRASGLQSRAWAALGPAVFAPAPLLDRRRCKEPASPSPLAICHAGVPRLGNPHPHGLPAALHLSHRLHA